MGGAERHLGVASVGLGSKTRLMQVWKVVQISCLLFEGSGASGKEPLVDEVVAAVPNATRLHERLLQKIPPHKYYPEANHPSFRQCWLASRFLSLLALSVSAALRCKLEKRRPDGASKQNFIDHIALHPNLLVDRFSMFSSHLC